MTLAVECVQTFTRPSLKRSDADISRAFFMGKIGGGCSAVGRACCTVAMAGLLFVPHAHMDRMKAFAFSGEGTAASDQDLPGSSADVRGLPNSPFTADANRLSDGISSSSPLSTTSPSFPMYLNKTDDAGDAWSRERNNATLQSRLEQGVSPWGAGSFEIAVARYTLVNGGYDNQIPSAVFPVKAWERWNPSGFAIQQGETYTVGALGDQYWIDGGLRSDAGGYAVHFDAIDACWVAVGSCRSFLRDSKPRLAPPRGRWMQLVCGIGDFVSRVREAVTGVERYLPISDARVQETLFPVGRNVTFVAEFTGELVCFANDAEGLYGNNRAALNVTVTRESWPPNGSVESAYQAYVEGAQNIRP